MFHLGNDEMQVLAYRLVADFVCSHYPAEEFLLSSVPHWIARLASSTPATASPFLQGGLPIGADGAATVSTPFVAMTVWMTMQELRARGLTPHEAELTEAVRAAARAMRASPKLSEELAKYLPGRLFAEAPLPSSPESTVPVLPEKHLYVEYCSEAYSELQEVPKIEPAVLPESEVDSRFRQQARNFALFVDWPRGLVLTNAAPINHWPELRAQARRLLWLVLQAFRVRVLPYQSIDRDVFAADRFTSGIAPSRSRLKKELCRELNCGLEKILSARPGENCFEICGQIPYCWIYRPEDSPLTRK